MVHSQGCYEIIIGNNYHKPGKLCVVKQAREVKLPEEKPSQDLNPGPSMARHFYQLSYWALHDGSGV